MGMSTILANEILDHLFGNGAYSPPTLYIGLYSSAPTDAGGGSELSGGSYARIAHAAWETAAARKTENDGVITFPVATGDWSAVTHVGVFDAISGGNMLFWTALDTARTALTGDQLRFIDNELDWDVIASADG